MNELIEEKLEEIMTIVAETNGDFEGDEKKVRAILVEMYTGGYTEGYQTMNWSWS